jgi:hypothetical protein
MSNNDNDNTKESLQDKMMRIIQTQRQVKAATDQGKMPVGWAEYV